jgi:hypothetical protein
MNDTITTVTATIIENRRRFEAFCFSLTDEEGMRPVPNSAWVVKDFASHLATVDTAFTRYINHVAAGGNMDMGRDTSGGTFSLDDWNDAEVAARRDWPIARIFDEARANREALIAALAGLTEDDISRTMHFTDPKRGEADFPLKLFLVGWAQHDPIHTADMLRALPDRATDPELQAWLANPFVGMYQTSMNR